MNAYDGRFKPGPVILVCLFIVLVLSFDVVGASSPYRPSIPLYIAIDRSGEVSVSSGKLTVPSYVVTLGAALDADKLNLFKKRLLVVRMRDQETLYDLHQYDIRMIQFDHGYYNATRVWSQDDALIVEVDRTLALNQQTTAKLANFTQIQTEVGRRSCFESVFKSGMDAVVAYPVRLRYWPYVPDDVDLNWIGSLRRGEKLIIRDKKCNAGVWLRVQRESGNVGWAKEWGLTEELEEQVYITEPAE